jgi:SAM-dependent methyltransferase
MERTLVPDPGAGSAAALADPRAFFWDQKILRWETARYSALAWLNPFSWTVRRRMRTVQRLLGSEFADCADVLDLGCGSGRLADALAADEGRRYLGVDFSAVAVEAARRRFAPQAARIRFERRNVLDAAGAGASLVVALGLLDWLDEGEVARWFRSLNGGRLCFSFTESDSGGAGLLYGQYRRVRDQSYRARNYPEAMIVESVESAGYRVDRIVRHSRLDPGRIVLATRR